jgi:hypothetical protein
LGARASRVQSYGGDVVLGGRLKSDLFTPTGVSAGLMLQGDVLVSSAQNANVKGQVMLTGTGGEGQGLAGATRGVVVGAGATVDGGQVTITGTLGPGAELASQAVRLEGTVVAGTMAEVRGIVNATASDAIGVRVDGALKSTGGGITIVADTLSLGASSGTPGAVDTQGAGRVVIKSDTPARAITLGRGNDDTSLDLSASDLVSIATPTLVVGDGVHTGGISIEGPVALATALVPNLSLITAGAIGSSSAGSLQVNGLNADGGQVVLRNASNAVSVVSGRARLASGAGFQLQNNTALTVGVVDGVMGIESASASNGIALNLAGALSQQNGARLAAPKVDITAVGGVALASQIQSVDVWAVNNSGGGDIAIDSGLYTAAAANQVVDLSNLGAAAGAIRLRATSGSVVINRIESGNATLTGRDALAAVSVEALGSPASIAASANGAGIKTAGGSVHLKTTGSIGSSANALTLDTAGPVYAVAGSDIALKLPAALSQLREVQTTGALSVQGMGGALALGSLDDVHSVHAGGVAVGGFAQIQIDGSVQGDTGGV